jgi:hypothetical protein
MKMSNTKLTPKQKIMRKNLRKSFGLSCVMHTVGRVTMFLQPEFSGSNMGLLSIAVASPKETKLRRKVGEYLALERAENGEYIKVPMASSLETIGRAMQGESFGDYSEVYEDGYSAGYDDGVMLNSDNTYD